MFLFPKNVSSNNYVTKFETLPKEKIPSSLIFQNEKQLSLANYLSPTNINDKILLFHHVGAGKTLTAITISEKIINTTDFKVIVIVKNNSLRDNFIQNLENSNYKYKSKTKRYSFLTYSEIVSKYNKNTSAKYDFSNKVIIMDEVHNITENKAYKALYEILSKSFNYKLILLTATPVYDSVTEIFSLSNIINVNESNFPDTSTELYNQGYIDKIKNTNINKNMIKKGLYSITEKGLIALKASFDGKVSFSEPSLNDYPEEINIGTSLSNKKGSEKIVFCEMSEYQYNLYKNALDLDTGNGQDKDSAVYLNSTYASTIVYPNNEFKKSSFDKYFINDNYISEIFDNLDKYSKKLKTLLENVKKSSGICFIYSNYINKAGIDLIKRLLQYNGYKRYNEDSINDGMNYITVDDFKKYSKILSSVNNKNGDYIKIFLGSPKLSEGVSVKSVREIHILEPDWNISKITQIKGRGLRKGSHMFLKEGDRNVKIFKYASIYSKDPLVLYIDKEKYIISEEKNRENKKIERMLKQISVDCSFNKKTGKDFSPECDYDLCNYVCDYNFDKSKIDYSTYFLNLPIYSDLELQVLEKYFKKIFLESDIWKLQDIVENVKTNTKIGTFTIYEYLDVIVKNKTIFKDINNRDCTINVIGDFYKITPINIEKFSSEYDKDFDYESKTPIKIFEQTIRENFEKMKAEEKLKTKIEKTKIKKQKSKKNIDYTEENTIIENEYNANIIKNNVVYATYFNKNREIDEKFRIIDNRRVKTTIDDKRSINTGMDIESFTTIKLLDLVSYFKLNTDLKTKKKLVEFIKTYMTDNHLVISFK